MSNFSFSHSIFKKLTLQTRENQAGFVWERVIMYLNSHAFSFVHFTLLFLSDNTYIDCIFQDCCIEQGVLLDCHSNPLFSPLEIQVGPNPLKECVLSTRYFHFKTLIYRLNIDLKICDKWQERLNIKEMELILDFIFQV